MSDYIIKDDGFAFQVLSLEDALKHFLIGSSVFAVYDDGTEALIETDDDLTQALMFDDVKLCLEIGYLN